MSFLFFTKPKTIYVDCFTTSALAYNMAQIEPSTKFIPQWWKDLPKSFGDHPHVRKATLKTCSGFLDLYRSSFMLPMWCDLAVDIGPIGSTYYKYQYSDFQSNAEVHDSIQMGKFCNLEIYQHLKLESPWYVVSKKNINWFFTDAIWNKINLTSYRVLNGIVNFKFNNGTHINMLFPRGETTKQILIPYKTPLLQLVPMTETNIKLKHHLVDEKTLEIKTTKKFLGIKFLNKSKNYKSEVLKCPIKHD